MPRWGRLVQEESLLCSHSAARVGFPSCGPRSSWESRRAQEGAEEQPFLQRAFPVSCGYRAATGAAPGASVLGSSALQQVQLLQRRGVGPGLRVGPDCAWGGGEVGTGLSGLTGGTAGRPGAKSCLGTWVPVPVPRVRPALRAGPGPAGGAGPGHRAALSLGGQGEGGTQLDLTPGRAMPGCCWVLSGH